MPPPDFAAMRKDPLMVEAKALGVQTRKEVVKVDGTKHRTWRSITDVAAECRIEWERRGVYALQRLYARLCQRSLCQDQCYNVCVHERIACHFQTGTIQHMPGRTQSGSHVSLYHDGFLTAS